jgi:hypothetical protein
MTKKHFIAAAEYVAVLDADLPTRALVARAFESLFQEFGGRFDVERFRYACFPGVESTQIDRAFALARRIGSVATS